MIDDESQDSPLYDAVMAVIEDRLVDVWTCMPARVETYDAARQKATVTILVRSAHVDEDEVRQVQTLPIIHEVPVKTNGGGGFSTSYPIRPGDTGLVWFCSASIDAWAQQGGIVDPRDDRRFDINDAVFEPGLRDFKHPLRNLPTDRARFGNDAGTVGVEVTGTEAILGGSAGAEHALKAETFLAALGTMVTAIGTAVGGIPGGAAAGTSIASALTAFQLVAATYTTTQAKVR